MTVAARLGALCRAWEAKAGVGWGIDLSDYGDEFVAGFVAGGEHAAYVEAAAESSTDSRSDLVEALKELRDQKARNLEILENGKNVVSRERAFILRNIVGDLDALIASAPSIASRNVGAVKPDTPLADDKVGHALTPGSPPFPSTPSDELRGVLMRCEGIAATIAALLDDERAEDTVATNSAWDYATTIQEIARTALETEVDE